MKIIAHRGASAERPENTLSAVERALEIGVDAVEVDLVITRDRRLAVRHDDLIEKDGACHFVNELTMEEIRTLDLGGGERVPELDEVLDLVQGRCQLVLDVKCLGTAPLLAPVLTRRRSGVEVHVTSFLHSEVVEIGRLCPDVARSINLAAVPLRFEAVLEGTGATQAGLFRGYLNERIVSDLHEHGVGVLAYPVNFVREAEMFAAWRVDAIYTDDPRAMRHLADSVN